MNETRRVLTRWIAAAVVALGSFLIGLAVGMRDAVETEIPLRPGLGLPSGGDLEAVSRHPLARLSWHPDPRLAERLQEDGKGLELCRVERCVFITQGEAMAHIGRMVARGIRKGMVAYCLPWQSGSGGVPLPTPTPVDPRDPYAPSPWAMVRCAAGTCWAFGDEILFWGYSFEEAQDEIIAMQVFMSHPSWWEDPAALARWRERALPHTICVRAGLRSP